MKVSMGLAIAALFAAAPAMSTPPPSKQQPSKQQPIKCRAELGNVRQQENDWRRLRNRGCAASLEQLKQAVRNVRAAHARYLGCAPSNPAGIQSAAAPQPRAQCPADRGGGGAQGSCAQLYKAMNDRAAAWQTASCDTGAGAYQKAKAAEANYASSKAKYLRQCPRYGKPRPFTLCSGGL